MKSGKVLLLCVYVDPAQNLTRWLCVLIQLLTNTETLRLPNSIIVNEHNTKDF